MQYSDMYVSLRINFWSAFPGVLGQEGKSAQPKFCPSGKTVLQLIIPQHVSVAHFKDSVFAHAIHALLCWLYNVKLCYQSFQREVSSHQPLTSSVVHTGQLLLSCINTMSPCQCVTPIFTKTSMLVIIFSLSQFFMCSLSALFQFWETPCCWLISSLELWRAPQNTFSPASSLPWTVLSNPERSSRAEMRVQVLWGSRGPLCDCKVCADMTYCK